MLTFTNTIFLIALKTSARLLEQKNSVLQWTQAFLLRKMGAAFTCIWRLSLAFSPGMNLFVDDSRNQFHCLNLIFFTAKTSPPKPRNLIKMLCNCHNNQHSFYVLIKWMFTLLYRICSEAVCEESPAILGTVKFTLQKRELLPKNLRVQLVTCSIFGRWPKAFKGWPVHKGTESVVWYWFD